MQSSEKKEGNTGTSSSSSMALEPPSSAPARSGESDEEEGSAKEAPVYSGIFAEGYAEAEQQLAQMSLREKVGQIFVFQCPSENARGWVEEYQPGGYCLMGVSFRDKTRDQVKAELQSYQQASRIPMILCTDEEGGTVLRVSRNPNLAERPFQAPQQVYQSGGIEAVREDTRKKIALLKDLGINMNLAPVADVSTNPANFIYDRSFGKDAAATAEFVVASVEVYQQEGMACSLKHFPGYGSNSDTHKALVRDERDYSRFTESDFVPFEAGIRAGAPCVMVNHNIAVSMDETRPASLSPRVHQVLREDLGFTGLIITDDLTMDGAADALTENPAVEAFLAGNDLLLTGYMQRDFEAVFSAALSGKISEERLDESVLRILAWKNCAGLWDGRVMETKNAEESS